jgi:hypothetical protein
VDRKELFGSVVKSEVRAQRELERKETRAEKAKQAKRREIEKRTAPFVAIEERHVAAMKSLKSFIKARRPNEWNVTDKNDKDAAVKRGILVVLGDAPKSDVTPDHVAVCLSAIQRPVAYRNVTNDANQFKAVFTFVLIPRESLQGVIEATGYPLDGIPTNGLIRRDEASNAGYEIRSAKGQAESPWDNDKGRNDSRRMYRNLHDMTQTYKQFEANLDWVMTAAADPELNPHLQVPTQALGSVALRGDGNDL